MMASGMPVSFRIVIDLSIDGLHDALCTRVCTLSSNEPVLELKLKMPVEIAQSIESLVDSRSPPLVS